MGRLEGMIKSEMARLAKRETKKISLSLGRDVRALKRLVSQLRRSVSTLERLASKQQKERRRIPPRASAEEVKRSRFSARLIRNLRKRLGITRKEMAALAGVSMGAVYHWEQGTFEPREKKREILVELRKLGRRAVRKLLEEKAAETGKGRRVTTRRKR